MKIQPLVTLKQALSQIRRNVAMTLASFISITAILLILGIFFILLVNINNISQSVKLNFDTIQVNLLDTTDQVQTQRLMQEVALLDGVSEVVYQSKEEAMDRWKEKWGDNRDLLDQLPVNPLPNAIILTLSDITYSEQVIAYLAQTEGIDRLNYSQDAVDKLLSVTNVIQLIAVVLIIFLLIISIIVVSNTIKLTVLAREKEITIMRYVGATNWFIRGPFLLEGIIIGIVSALIAAILISSVYHWLVQSYGVNFILVMSTGLVRESYLMGNMMPILLAIGVSIGACGSIISMRRFLAR